MSTSISRGPFTNVGVRPTRRSTVRVIRRSSPGVPLQAISTAAFQKSGWSRKPTGSVR
jgi:hypothetical protein